jgi:uncharacterized protein (DUF2062 family)
VVFRRRVRLGFWGWLREGLWPRGGWRRAAEYVRHRIRRLPDTPEKIGRGVWAGVFASFTPLFGLHFVIALLLAKVIRGNLLASLIGTFFGNPLTLVPIGLVAMNLGYFLLGSRPEAGVLAELPEVFAAAGQDLWRNIAAVFGRGEADWAGLAAFWDEVFLPYLVGGAIPGAVVATACYGLTVPLVRVHQARRKKRLAERLVALEKNFAPPPDLPPPAG